MEGVTSVLSKSLPSLYCLDQPLHEVSWLNVSCPGYRNTLKPCMFDIEIHSLLLSCMEQQYSKKGKYVVGLSHLVCVRGVQISMELLSCSKWLLLYYRHVGHYIFKELINKHHPRETTQIKETSFDPAHNDFTVMQLVELQKYCKST